MKQLDIYDLTINLEQKSRLTDNTKLRTFDYHVLEILKTRAVGKENRLKAQEIIELLELQHGYIASTIIDVDIRKSINRLRKYYSQLSIESITGKHGGTYIRTENDKKNNTLLNKTLSHITTIANVGLPEERITNINAIYKHLNDLVNRLDLPPNHQLKMKFTGHERDEVNYTGEHYAK